MKASSSPIGPIWQTVLKTIWKNLFDPSSSLYLPHIIKNGDPSLGLPIYDPTTVNGKSKPFPIKNVDSSVVSQACTDSQSPIPPKGSAPTLALGDVKMLNLSNMSPVSISFAPNTPQLTIAVTVGTAATPFTLEYDGTNPNFYFEVQCCEPVSVGSSKCNKNWTTSANGQFTAKVTKFDISATATLNTPPTVPTPTITINDIDLSVAPSDIDLNFNVASLPKWAQSLAKIAVQQGVNNNAIQGVIEMFLNQPSVKGDIEKLINDQLAKIWKQGLAIGNGSFLAQ
ncbi:MAG: hypothetical protein KTR22_12255 [Flavobacteriaceae bacterium]|nr:hypothetical protein [Flavobacteriaceae bacterium]